MSRQRKPARELTNDEALAKLFPKKALKKAQEETAKPDNKAIKKESKE
jgi:hypothetical protein